MTITSSTKSSRKETGSSVASSKKFTSPSSSFSLIKDKDSNKNKENRQPGGASKNGDPGKEDQADKYKRFEDEGVVIKAKLIGSELVMEPRGDKMCQNSIQRLKAIIKGTNSHKRRIILKISFDGVKIYDEKTNENLHHHEVPHISFISSDDTDSRAFGYVTDVSSGAHQFICFKTSGPAMEVMSVISGLFEAVLERKNQAEKEKSITNDDSNKEKDSSHQDSLNLIGDSGIMDGDISIGTATDNDNSKLQLTNNSIFDNSNAIVTSPGNSFSNSSVNQGSTKQLPNADLILDDLFSMGLSDPIIVDKNDSLISYSNSKPHSSNVDYHNNQNQNQQIRHQPSANWSDILSSSGPAIGSNSSISMSNSGASQLNLQFQQHQPPSSSHQLSGLTPSRPIPRRQQSVHLPPPPSSLPRPAPLMSQAAISTNGRNRSLVYNHSSVSLSDAALTRQPSFASSVGQNDSQIDRYAVFNDIDSLPSIFESTSLGSISNITGNMTGAATATTPQAPVLSTGPATAPTMFRQTNPFDDAFFA